MKRIIVPIDFSPSSANALKYAVEFSSFFGCTICMFHCYPLESFNRKYDFGKTSYDVGIKKKMEDFLDDCCIRKKVTIQILTKKGGIADTIIAESENSSIVVLSGNVTKNAFDRFLGKRSSIISSGSKCPVLFIPPQLKYINWKKIWHIKRSETEKAIILPHLQNLRIQPSQVEEKTLEQKKFISSFWNLMTTYWKEQEADPAFEILIKEAKSQERIDLFILVSHKKSTFQNFLNVAAKHALFKNGIPALVIQNSVS